MAVSELEKQLAPTSEGEVREGAEDPKAKKDPKKAAAPVEEDEGTGNEIKISLDLANPNES